MAGTNTPKITHILFDMDGLLLDTEGFYTKAQSQVLAKYGKKFDWSLKAKMMGKPAMESALLLVKELSLEGVLAPEDFLTQREAILDDLFPNSELMPGADRLVRHFHKYGIKMAVATSSHTRFFKLKTQKHKEFMSVMHHVVTGDDPEVLKGKPSPDIFLVGAKRFEEPSLKPENVLVFEDAPSGVQAAKAAGMSAVMVPDPNLDKAYQKEADEVLTSLLEFDPSKWGLPAFDTTAEF
eukprot:TRINITY_DN8719_c0_g1_i1.p1 TRINITY_DN8719_c0_g1~~TRINITY_DN8719_c0_g1_i1.p1  ORF type:complete len:238 (-),score=62.25 TRINITY_DN8719_c0_g1_i1:169-882(-)